VKRLLFLFLISMMAFPVVASAMFPADELPDSPLRHENNPAAAQVTAGPQITVTRGGSSNTLPIVLAAASLGIALGGTAYMTVRVRSV
jgi:hypothetical protein